MSIEQQQPRIAIVGGGFGGLFTALELSGAGEVTIINREEHFLFTPMLYEYLSGEVEAWHIAPYYKDLISDEQIRFIKGEVANIDLEAREIHINGRVRPVGYDVLVLAVGGVTNYAGVEGAQEFAMPFRKIADADALRKRMTDALDRVPPNAAPQDARRAVTFAVVGAGASGVELSTKMSDLLRDAFQRRGLAGEPHLLILEMGDRVVPGMGDELYEHVTQALSEARIEVHTQTRVVSVGQDHVVFEHAGERTKMEMAGVVWVGGVRVSPLVEKLSLEKNERGLIIAEQTLQARGREEVFVLGDNAYYEDLTPQLYGTAQLAFQQATLAAENIRALLSGKQLRTKHFAEMGEALSLGTENGAVLVGDKAVGGALARQARFTLYTSRLPTWHHRLKVGASWFFSGTTARPLGI